MNHLPSIPNGGLGRCALFGLGAAWLAVLAGPLGAQNPTNPPSPQIVASDRQFLKDVTAGRVAVPAPSPESANVASIPNDPAAVDRSVESEPANVEVRPKSARSEGAGHTQGSEEVRAKSTVRDSAVAQAAPVAKDESKGAARVAVAVAPTERHLHVAAPVVLPDKGNDADLPPRPGTKVTVTTTTTESADGRTTVTQKKVTTYEATPAPLIRRAVEVAEEPQDHRFFHRLFHGD